MPANALFNTDSVQVASIADLVPIVPGAIVTKPLIDTGAVKQILFAMDAGQEISQHKAPFPATVHVLDGHLSFTIEGKTYEMPPGTWMMMPPSAPHSLRATQPCRMLLTLIKESRQ